MLRVMNRNTDIEKIRHRLQHKVTKQNIDQPWGWRGDGDGRRNVDSFHRHRRSRHTGCQESCRVIHTVVDSQGTLIGMKIGKGLDDLSL